MIGLNYGMGVNPENSYKFAKRTSKQAKYGWRNWKRGIPLHLSYGN